MRLFTLLVCLAFLCYVSNAYAQTEALRIKINAYLQLKQAEVGVAIYDLEKGDTLTINENKQYPMQSVYKFHLALAVLKQVDKGKLALNQKLLITKQDLIPKTWSPMRDKYPDGNVKLALAEILEFTVAKSDNNGCDVLFRLLGGPEKVNQFMHRLGVEKINIAFNEDEMHQSFEAQYSNWTTPYTTVALLKAFYEGKLLSKKSTDFLKQTLISTSTGPKRIKGLLPEGTVVAHKTGTSGVNDEGVISAVNDVGILTLPNGKYVALAVYVSKAKETEAACEKMIAEVSKMVWDEFSK
jgi:beta-lactamase class A